MRRPPLSVRRELRGRGAVNTHQPILMDSWKLKSSLMVISCLPCRERRGSQGSEPYSPYDFSEDQDVPESKRHPLFFCIQLFHSLTRLIQDTFEIVGFSFE